MILFVWEKCLVCMMVVGSRDNLFCLAVSFAVRMKNDIQKIVQGESSGGYIGSSWVGGDGNGICFVLRLF